MVGESGRHRDLEEGCECAVPRYWQQDHSHRDIAEMSGHGNGCQSTTPDGNSRNIIPTSEVVAQRDPPDTNGNSI